MFGRIVLSLVLIMTSFSAVQAEQPDAAQFIQFVEETDADTSSDCTQRGGLRVFVINNHPDNIIDLQIDRYFSDVRQPGRSMFALKHGQKLAMGCNIVMDSPQRWELVNATFISAEKAQERYGTVF